MGGAPPTKGGAVSARRTILTVRRGAPEYRAAAAGETPEHYSECPACGWEPAAGETPPARCPKCGGVVVETVRWHPTVKQPRPRGAAVLRRSKDD